MPDDDTTPFGTLALWHFGPLAGWPFGGGRGRRVSAPGDSLAGGWVCARYAIHPSGGASGKFPDSRGAGAAAGRRRPPTIADGPLARWRCGALPDTGRTYGAGEYVARWPCDQVTRPGSVRPTSRPPGLPEPIPAPLGGISWKRVMFPANWVRTYPFHQTPKRLGVWNCCRGVPKYR